MDSYTIASGSIRQYTAPLHVKTVDLNTEGHRLTEVCIADLRDLNTDVLIIRNFLSHQEARSILKNLVGSPEVNLPLANSKTVPFSFAELDRNDANFKQHLDEYFLKSRQFRGSFARIYEVDMERKFTDILTVLNRGKQAHVLNTKNGGSYIPFTFRMIVPEKNHINLHCDNMFADFAPEFYQELTEVATVKNQLSFFTVLDKAESGGELSVYNVAWDVAKEFNIAEQTVILEDGRHLHAGEPKELYRSMFDLEQGDLVVFAGGQLYHRIEEVYGSKMRITLGGFIGFSKVNSDIYYWS